MKKYGALLADPPWQRNQTGGHGGIHHYPLMSLDEICALRIDRLVATDSHLWLWTPNSNIMDGLAVMEAWGFSYRSCLTWVKLRLGLGVYLRNASEQLLFAIRGRAPMLFCAQPTWLFAPVQEHSHKPEEVFAIIERCSPGPYLELFARRKRPGWHAWGNEVTCDVAL